MWLENFILSLSVSLNCLGAFLPRLFYSPWASSFQAWGLRKGSDGGFPAGDLQDPNCSQWATHVFSHARTDTSPHPWPRSLDLRRPCLAFRASLLPLSSPPPSQLPFTSPRPTATSRLLAPGGSSRNFFLFNARQATRCSQMSGKAQ